MKMLELVIQIIICGIATAAICRTIAYYEGPFHVFPRIKAALLPESHITQPTYDIQEMDDLLPFFSQILMEQQKYESLVEMWEVYHTLHNPKFYQGFRGTMYGILSCPFCLGPYVSGVMSAVSTLYVMVTTPYAMGPMHVVLNWLLVTFGCYGLHFIISKRWGDDN